MNGAPGTSQPGGAAETPAVGLGAVFKDKANKLFNPLVHLMRNGLPVLNRITGRFMPKGGRKPGTKNKPKMETPAPSNDTARIAETTAASSTAENGVAGSPTPSPAPEPANPQLEEMRKLLADDAAPTGAVTPAGGPKGDQYTLAAAGTVSALSTLAILAMGAHVKPSEQQTVAMVDAYAAAYRHYGYKPEVPPWLGPVVATVVWIGPHFADERSQTTLQSWKSKFTSAWLWVQGKFAGRAAASAAGDAHR